MNILDPKEYIETFLLIKGKDQKIIPFILNRPQLDYYANRSSRNILLKARQLGFSTLQLALFYHNTITTPATNTVLVAHKREQAVQFLAIIKLFYKYTPAQFRPKIKYCNKYEMTFPRMESMIKIISPSQDAGRGLTIHNLHASELAFWPYPETTWSSLFEAVPAGGNITIESTPNGIGNLFHKMYLEALEKRSSFTAHKYRWDWLYSDDWARKKKEDIGPTRWAQEYDCDFIQSGRPVFDASHLKCAPASHGALGGYPTGLFIYAKPALAEYVIGADTAEGLPDGDYSCAIVLNRSTGEEVAHVHGRWAPEIFAKKLDWLGRFYNNANLGVERNNHGHTVLLKLKELQYPNIYHHRDYDQTGKTSLKPGFPTNAKTKPIMIDDLEEALRKGFLKLRTPALIDELLVYQYDQSGSTSAPAGYNDDRVIALAIAWQLRKAGRKKPTFKARRTERNRLF